MIHSRNSFTRSTLLIALNSLLIISVSCTSSQFANAQRENSSLEICDAYSKGIEWYTLVEGNNQGNNGYFLLTTLDFDILNNGEALDTHKYCEQIRDLLSRTYTEQGVGIGMYDIGFIDEDRLIRFDSIETCDLIDLYFDENGNYRKPGLTSPTAYLIASLLKRGVKVHATEPAVFYVDQVLYCSS